MWQDVKQARLDYSLQTFVRARGLVGICTLSARQHNRVGCKAIESRALYSGLKPHAKAKHPKEYCGSTRRRHQHLQPPTAVGSQSTTSNEIGSPSCKTAAPMPVREHVPRSMFRVLSQKWHPEATQTARGRCRQHTLPPSIKAQQRQTRTSFEARKEIREHHVRKNSADRCTHA